MSSWQCGKTIKLLQRTDEVQLNARRCYRLPYARIGTFCRITHLLIRSDFPAHARWLSLRLPQVGSMHLVHSTFLGIR